jgi:DNA-binding MarR family transcriptional regulator
MASSTRIANEAWEALFRAQATIAQELSTGEVWGDLLPREYGVLYALSTAPDGLRITELGNDVLLSQPGMSRLIARLEARGLVERADDPHDARACRIRLTPAGVRVQRQVGAAHGRQIAATMTRTLSRDQLAVLRDLCRELTRATDNISATHATTEAVRS